MAPASGVEGPSGRRPTIACAFRLMSPNRSSNVAASRLVLQPPGSSAGSWGVCREGWAPVTTASRKPGRFGRRSRLGRRDRLPLDNPRFGRLCGSGNRSKLQPIPPTDGGVPYARASHRSGRFRSGSERRSTRSKLPVTTSLSRRPCEPACGSRFGRRESSRAAARCGGGLARERRNCGQPRRMPVRLVWPWGAHRSGSGS